MWTKKKLDNQKWIAMNREVARLMQEEKLDEALDLARDVFDYTRKCYGKKDRKTIVALNNIGTVNLLKKNFDEAEAHLLLALQLSEKVSGKEGRQASMINMNLAELYSARAKSIRENIEVFGEQTPPG
jgi:tetratricopeptide (TPR) repeat protein